MSEFPYPIPSNWAWTTIGEAFIIILGQSPPSNTYNEDGVGLPFFQGKAEFGEIYPVTRKWCSEPKKIAEKGDILLSVRAPVGPTNLNPQRSCIGRGLAAIRGVGGIQPLFVLYLLRAFENRLKEQTTGTTFAAITGKKLEKIPVPIPPLAEQNRIVGRVEELFSWLDKGVRSLHVVQTQLDQYRQKTLKHVFQQSIENENMIPLGEIIRPSKERFDPTIEENTHYIGLGDIESNTGRIINVGNSKDTKSLKSVFRESDLLYGRLRPYLNKVVVPDFDGVCSTDILVFQQRDIINNKYLQYLMLSSDFVDYTSKRMSGVQHPRIKYTDIAKYEVPLINLEKQINIVNKLGVIFSIIENTNKSISLSLKKCDGLNKSILEKAFSGKLVEQNLSDEHALDLLKKMKNSKIILIKKTSHVPTKLLTDTYRAHANNDDSSLTKILIEHGDKMRPYNLYKLSNLSISDFYSQLRKDIDNRKIIEIRPNKKVVFLEIYK